MGGAQQFPAPLPFRETPSRPGIPGRGGVFRISRCLYSSRQLLQSSSIQASLEMNSPLEGFFQFPSRSFGKKHAQFSLLPYSQAALMALRMACSTWKLPTSGVYILPTDSYSSTNR